MLARRLHKPPSFQNHYWSLITQKSLSTTTLNDPPASPQLGQNRVPLTLYRQLLSWCRRYKDMPFDGFPPLTLTPPQVNPTALKRLRSMRSFLESHYRVHASSKSGQWRHPAHFALYNPNVSVEHDMILFSKIQYVGDLRDLIRSVFWLNNVNSILGIDPSPSEGGSDCNDSEYQDARKEQLSLAFDAIKSCNQLSSTELDNRRARRLSSIEIRQKQLSGDDVANVDYHVGQIVTHRSKGWRGVVVGWNIEDEKTSDGQLLSTKLTSLTTKQYSLPRSNQASVDTQEGEDGNQVSIQANIRYTVLVDINDAALLKISNLVSLESQQDLAVVEEQCLQRIHNSLIKKYFTKFESHHFVPNKVLAYVYPLDCFAQSSVRLGAGKPDPICDGKHSQESQLRERTDTSCRAIVDGVQKISVRIASTITRFLPPTAQETIHNSLGETVLASVRSMQIQDINDIESDPLPSSTIRVLEKLAHFQVKINTMLRSRKFHLDNNQKTEFSLGQIVKHKLYGYRGVVVAWDPKPYFDVTNWDGLQHIDNPQNQPFYHVRPDENDCILIFGGPRSFRYVCQENLELCRETEVEVDLNTREWTKSSECYIPSEELKFLYGENVGPNQECIEECLQSLRNTLSGCLLSVRGDTTKEYFTMDDLFNILHATDTLEDATIVQDMIKEIWKESQSSVLRNKLDSGIESLVEGNNENALAIFAEIVAADPDYGEAHNKLATVHFMMGHVQESLDAAREALRIEPRNFQALAGIGLVEMELSSNVEKATDAFRKCLALNPWSMVSARLSKCIRKTT